MEEKKYPIGGFAPGNYTCKCCICKQEFQGDKRAVQCEPCALEALRELLKPYEQPGPVWVKASERLPNNPDDPLNHYRLHGRKVNGNFYQDSDGVMFFEVRGSTHEPYLIGWKSFQYLEWLDESGTVATPTGSHWLNGQYDKLYDQVKGGKRTVCWVDYEPAGVNKTYRDICAINHKSMCFSIRGRGYGGVHVGENNEKANFIAECERLNVEWLCEGSPAAGSEEELPALLHWLTRDSFLELIGGQWTAKNDEDGTCPFSHERIIEMYQEFKQQKEK